MAKIIGLVNQKGGVAKTSSTINLGDALTELGKKILLVDNDPQGNLTSGLGIIDTVEKTLYDCLMNELPLVEAIYKTDNPLLDIIPAGITLANAELELANTLGRESILKEIIENNPQLEYDYILIDCNPSLGLLTVNALVACDSVIIPLEAAKFSYQGIEQLVKLIQMIRKKLNSKLAIEGVLLTRFDARTNLSKEFEEQLAEIFKDKMFETKIHVSSKIPDSQAVGQSVIKYSPKSKPAMQYKSLAKEIIK